MVLWSSMLSSVDIWFSCHNLSISWYVFKTFLWQGNKAQKVGNDYGAYSPNRLRIRDQKAWNRYFIVFNYVTPVKAWECPWYCFTIFYTIKVRLALILGVNSWTLEIRGQKGGPENIHTITLLLYLLTFLLDTLWKSVHAF